MKTRKVRTLTPREFPPWWLISSADSSMIPWGDVSSQWQRTTSRDDESAPSAGHQGPRSPGRRRLEHRPWWPPGVFRPLRQASRRGSCPSPGATFSVRPPPATLLDMQVFLLLLSHSKICVFEKVWNWEDVNHSTNHPVQTYSATRRWLSFA